jgi:ubiquinone/menaquinone biosynthesis C-methylase UbiE
MQSAQDSLPTEARWQRTEVAERYAGERFAGSHAGRDLRLVRRLIERFDGRNAQRAVLDLPAGTGRLHDGLSALSSTVVGVDVSAAMLERSAYRGLGRALLADARRLPFRDDSFDVVVSCRLLHHFDDEQATRALAEFLRVSNRLVVASFWDAACLTETRKRLRLRERTDARRAISRARIARLASEAGGSVLGHASSFRFFSPQTFVALRPNAR